jgi:Fe-S cluster biogenesis protein NfuA
MKNYIENIIKPKLQGDGGEIDFVSYEDGILTVLLQGECSKCLILDRCLKWIEERIKIDLGQDVKVIGIRKKPYFQDV